MEVPLVNAMCPPGLEYLARIDQLLIKQKVNITQVFTGCEMNFKFNVKNTLGQDVRKLALFISFSLNFG